MRTNKVINLDLFTAFANKNYQKHVKTHSKNALVQLNKKINWAALLLLHQKYNLSLKLVPARSGLSTQEEN